eukprot:TRINITY_DN15718_c0_g1_i1.p1 TRINITY_DN15718_c0_g1~~TRINITY_DN15718_c0_g1_i1.p1  ORF type:complete len:164 (+),score=23.36 TRINITY_DN15718_c0_g1_i1:73-564(+)
MPPRRRRATQSKSPAAGSPIPEVGRPFECVTLTPESLVFKKDLPREYVVPELALGGGDIIERVMKMPQKDGSECGISDLISCVASGKLPFLAGCSYETSDLIKELKLYAESVPADGRDIVFSNTFLDYVAWLRAEQILQNLDTPTPKPIWGECVDAEMQTEPN